MSFFDASPQGATTMAVALLTSEFAYELPPERIAQIPIEPRHDARLLDTRDLSDHTFRDLADLLAPGDLVVVNRTRVRAARLLGTKVGSGGRVEALLLGPHTDDLWRAVVKPARRLRPGTELDFGPIVGKIEAGPADGQVLIHLKAEGNLEEAIAEVGQLPLPPYIHTALPDPERYQTMFARETGSAAAPTAGLHFTPAVVASLRARSIDIVEIELHIGLDTFRPISTVTIGDHRIHTEEFMVPAATRQAVEDCQGRVVAIGTTVVRALESGIDEGTTSLFITPGFEFKMVDLLVTNFHIPRTTLLVLLASFMGPAWRPVYETALQRHYRFASFGDAMLAKRSR